MPLKMTMEEVRHVVKKFKDLHFCVKSFSTLKDDIERYIFEVVSIVYISRAEIIWLIVVSFFFENKKRKDEIKRENFQNFPHFHLVYIHLPNK